MQQLIAAACVLLLAMPGDARAQDDPQAKLADFEGTWTDVGQEAIHP